MSLTTGVSHVGLTVSDITKTLSFFEAVGFKKVGGVPDYPSIFLSNGHTLITVWAAKCDNPVPFNRRTNVGLHHLAIKVPSMDALETALEAVKKINGVEIEDDVMQIPGMPMSMFMCYEPCGVRVEFTYHHE